MSNATNMIEKLGGFGYLVEALGACIFEAESDAVHFNIKHPEYNRVTVRETIGGLYELILYRAKKGSVGPLKFIRSLYADDLGRTLLGAIGQLS